MDGRYPPPIPPLTAFYHAGYPQMMVPEYQPNLHQIQTLSMEHLGTYPNYEDPNQTMVPAQGSQRRRRQQQAAGEHVKHRRTRSGCYTCRQRRVKCDENRPTCERCRKGKRECNYPGSSSSSARQTKSPKSRDSPGGSSPSVSDGEGDESNVLSAIPDDEDLEDVKEEDSESATFESRIHATSDDQRYSIPTSSPLTGSRRNSRPQVSRANSKVAGRLNIWQGNRWDSLPADVKFYLNFFRSNITYHYYAFKYDSSDFLKTTFIEIALNDSSQALLYGIVAFSAYHHSLTRSDNNDTIFLSYYNKAIMHLNSSITAKKRNVATLLTTLQLAAIEEYLGDWVNLLGHQRGAHHMLTELFTPQTIMQDETRRKAIAWYIRFDIYAGIMAGGDTTLSREWFAVCSEFYRQKSQQHPDDLGARFEAYFSTSRLLATDVTLLLAARRKSLISHEQFRDSVSKLANDFATYGQAVETAFTDSSLFVKSFGKAPPPNENDISDFRDPNFLYAGELSTMNFVLIDFWSIYLMFKFQISLASQQTPPPECEELILKACKMMEAIQYGDEGPAGGLLGAQAALGLAILFLPKDEKHTTWLRRMFARVEQLGYIYPMALRIRMKEIRGVDVSRWWLDNDEGYPPTVRKLREFTENRDTPPTDDRGVGLRDMAGIFQTLNIK